MRHPLLLPGLLIPLGIVLNPWLNPQPIPLILAIGVCGLLAWLGGSWSAAGAACLLLGLLRASLWVPGPTLHSPGISAHGVVTQASSHRATLELRTINGAPALGPLALHTSTALPVGAQVAVFGPIGPSQSVTLPGSPSPQYTAQVSGRNSVLKVQSWVPFTLGRPRINGDFKHTENPGLLRALSSGLRDDIPQADQDTLTHTGTRHLLAISGLHIGLLAAGATWLLRILSAPLLLIRHPQLGRLLRWIPAVGGMTAALLFAYSVGSPISAQRAAAMVCGGLLGNASGRGMQPWNLLGGAAAGLCLVDPGSPVELSFQLSFGAVAGLLTVTPRLERYLPPDLNLALAWAARSLFASVGATIGTLPAVALHFQEISLLSPLANLVAVPLMGAVAVPCALLGSKGWILPLALADGSISLSLQWLRWLESAPSWTLVHPALGMAGAALLMCSVLLIRWPGTAGSSALLIFGLHGRPLQTQVDFLAIGQGDGALIQLPDGRTILVDAGPPGAQPLFWLRRQGITHIDEVVISHPHPDHYGGVLPILEALSVGAVRVPRGPVEGEKDYARIWSLAQSKGVPILTGQDPVLDPQRLQIHHPEPSFLAQFKDDPNEISLVLELRDGGHRVLFTGDVEDAGEHALRALNLGPIDILKVAHHGSHTSSDPRLMAQWQPRLAVISCGVDNRFRHPRPQTLWTHRAWPVLRTDQDGTVQLSLGPELRVRTWKGTWSAWQELPAELPQRLD